MPRGLPQPSRCWFLSHFVIATFYAAILDVFVDSYFRPSPPKISLERAVFLVSMGLDVHWPQKARERLGCSENWHDVRQR
jgi:hypothetical protein